nr:hypothetical protein [Salinispora cortesiana]
MLFPLPLIGMSLTDNAILGRTLYGLAEFFVMIGNAVGGIGCLAIGVWMISLLRRHRAELAAAFAPPPTESTLAVN